MDSVQYEVWVNETITLIPLIDIEQSECIERDVLIRFVSAWFGIGSQINRISNMVG